MRTLQKRKLGCGVGFSVKTFTYGSLLENPETEKAGERERERAEKGSMLEQSASCLLDEILARMGKKWQNKTKQPRQRVGFLLLL